MKTRLRHTLRLTDVALLLGAVCWGSTFLVVKLLLVDPLWAPALVAARMLLSAGALVVFVLVTRRGGPTSQEWRSGILLGLPLSAVFALETFGIGLTSATNAGTLTALCIVLVPFAEAAVRRTRVRPALVALCAAAVVGAWLLTSGGGFSAPGVGDLLVLASTLARVAHVTMSSALQARNRPDPYRLTAIQLGTVGVVFTIACPILGTPVEPFLASLDPGRLALLLYLGVVAGAVVFAVQAWGIAATSATHASLLLGTEPVWAAAFGVFVAGDRLNVAGAAGIGVMLVAVLLAQRLSAREQRLGDPARPGVITVRASAAAPGP
ncbi:MAG: DMT family transporter [Actinobacteria bacterium]|nr:DMT family transporter [Actinomycetota bacterium]